MLHIEIPDHKTTNQPEQIRHSHLGTEEEMGKLCPTPAELHLCFIIFIFYRAFLYLTPCVYFPNKNNLPADSQRDEVSSHVSHNLCTTTALPPRNKYNLICKNTIYWFALQVK